MFPRAINKQMIYCLLFLTKEKISTASPFVWMEYPRGADLHFSETGASR
jgi:hypothetical protein